MKYAIIFYEHVVRDYSYSSRLALALYDISNHEIKAELFSIRFQWSQAVKFAKEHEVCLVMAPHIRREVHDKQLEPFYRFNRDVRFVCLNSEQLGSSISIDWITPKSEFCCGGVFHFVWAESFASVLKKHGVPEENIIITGNARLSDAVCSNCTRAELADKFKLDINKPWILFAESRNTAAMTEKRFFDRYLQTTSEENLLAQIDYYQRSLDSFLNQLNALPEAFFDEYEFIYRLHPGQPLMGEIPPRVHVIAECPIADWLRNIDLFISSGSTSIFEAEAANVPIVFHSPIPVDERFLVEGTSNYAQIIELGEINDQLISDCKSSVESSKNYEHYMGTLHDDAITMLAVKSIECLSHDTTDFVRPIRGGTRFALKRIGFERLSHLEYRLGLLEKTHMPKVAYRNIRDVPPSWTRVT